MVLRSFIAGGVLNRFFIFEGDGDKVSRGLRSEAFQECEKSRIITQESGQRG